MPGIFISYRRSDSGMAAGRLYDHLSGRFGAPQVFMDVTSLKPGENFVEAIRSTIDQCDVMLAIIGRQWLSTADENDQRRLDQPDDYVRQELALALQKGIRVIPVLVDDAAMPRPSDLPPDLKKLALHNGLSVRNESFKENMNYLIQTILDFRASAEPPLSPLENTASFRTVTPPISFARQKRNQWIWIAVVVVLLPLNCLYSSVPVLVGTLTLALLVPVAWPFARNMVLIAQIVTLLVLLIAFGADYGSTFSSTDIQTTYLILGSMMVVTVLNLLVVRWLCKRSLFELHPNR